MEILESLQSEPAASTDDFEQLVEYLDSTNRRPAAWVLGVDMIERLEADGLIDVTRPVHPDGTAYDSQYWKIVPAAF
jgi:hypothetical protein